MKYVFHDVFWSSSAPKACLDIIEVLKRTSGSEMLTVYLPKFLDLLERKIAEANKNGRHAKFELYHHQNMHNTDHKVHGQICIHQDGMSGKKCIARIDYIEVNQFWTFSSAEGNLELCHFDNSKSRQTDSITADDIMRRMVDDLRSGLPVEEVVDMYVACASPELREKLIDGLKEIVAKGGKS